MSLPTHPDRPLEALAPPGTEAFDDQRLLLLELLVDPPSDGDSIAELASALRRPVTAMAAAIEALVRAGLADVRGDRVRASAIAFAFDALWPVCL